MSLCDYINKGKSVTSEHRDAEFGPDLFSEYPAKVRLGLSGNKEVEHSPAFIEFFYHLGLANTLSKNLMAASLIVIYITVMNVTIMLI